MSRARRQRERLAKDLTKADYSFQCPTCNARHTKSPYCIAQQAQGHEIIFTCTCGNKFEVPS